MYSNDRNAYRQAFFITWQKFLNKQSLTPAEWLMVEVIQVHPEYHALLNNQQSLEKQEFVIEENPFFHMSLHMALREQIHLDRPSGIKAVYEKLLKTYDALEAEHKMMACLAIAMQKMQISGEPFDDTEYMRLLT